MKLEWSSYKHFPYEKELALREVRSLIGDNLSLDHDGSIVVDHQNTSAARLLTYFSAISDGDERFDTVQQKLERSGSSRERRQSTRYSVHGMHEYRGKFNPQVCRALMNILGAKPGSVLLDPFCGSGTTLVEAAHRGVRAIGTDLNPLAVYIANAKLEALTTPAHRLREALDRIVARQSVACSHEDTSNRMEYLRSWFEPENLEQIEKTRSAIAEEEVNHSFYFTIASNLIREYSLQDPADLRIRRRSSANTTVPFMSAFEKSAMETIRRLQTAQAVVGTDLTVGQAFHRDNRDFDASEFGVLADIAITSPPYATALPYIDTQRLSLIWLGLLEPKEIGLVESDLTGSREMRSQEKRRALDALQRNTEQLPDSEWRFCLSLQRELTSQDGFRRQAVPSLLYRYFVQMKKMFESTSKALKVNAPFALIVGHNHTVLGGRRFDIDTPGHLVSLANSVGWTTDEVTALQAYQRFGMHASNAVQAETLIVVRNSGLPDR